MVGLFSFGNKALSGREPLARLTKEESPPPYDEVASSSVVLATTTTTEVMTTTTQTTQFFSLPLWRKRAPVPTVSYARSTDDHGVLQSDASRFPMFDKDLPPTPPPEAQQQAGPSSLTDPSRCASNSTSSRPPLEPRKSTLALAQASLGVGLPHIIPHTSPSSSSTEVNTVAFLSSVSLPRSSSGSSSGVRRSKSVQKIKSSHPDATPLFPRTRNLSLGDSNIQSHVNGSKTKGKERDQTTHPEPSPKVLSRRPSFWSRKKQTAPPEQEILRGEPRRLNLPSPSLPALPPISPFFTEDRSTASPEPQVDFARPRSGSLLSIPQRPRTSYSYVTHSQPGVSAYDAFRHSTVSSHPRRPMTADSSSRSPIGPFFTSPSPNLVLSPVHGSTSLTSPPSPTCITELPARRARAQTNPPILHRLSLNLFSSPFNTSATNQSTSSTLVSTHASPRTSVSRKTVDIPRPEDDDESPEVYLRRLRSAVSKAEIAGVLASSATPFHVRALRTYLEEFNFSGDSLDVALRKLLMDVGLPRETQQIDRVIEAFAVRYVQCNPDLFASEDHPYILAFSLIMLHTDAFNKSNKRKMTKADYIKNTRLPGVPSEVLDCFYDNIVFAPFIFVEDPLDVNGQRGVATEGLTRKPSIGLFGNVVSNGAHKVDPYYLISNNMLAPLRVKTESYVPLTNPYSYQGTNGSWDEEALQRSFAKATLLEVGAVDHARASPFFGLSVGGAPSPLLGNIGALPEVYLPSTNEVWTLKIAKVGLLNRKDDLSYGGKKANNRKWKAWSIILTGSQLLFFRDSSWASTLAARREQSDAQVIFPQATIFKPDELFSLKDAIAVYDKSYTRHDHTLRLAMADGRQFLLRTSSELELNNWIACINYASAFKSAGVRMRPLGMSGKDVQLTGVAAAASHIQDLEQELMPAPLRRRTDDQSQEMMDLSGKASSPRHLNRRITVVGDNDDVASDAPMAPEIDGADQFKATFDEVKARLAAGDWEVLDDPLSTVPISPVSQFSERSRLPSRSHIITSKIHELNLKISAAQGQLDADLRFTRNIAILSPFQKATRDRLEISVQGVARRIMQMRLEIARHECHREVLSKDLAAEQRDWEEANQLALKAAAETLQSRGRSKPVPRMTLSLHDGNSPSISPVAAFQGLHSAPHSESSISESFYSAVDFGSDWPLLDDPRSTAFLNTSRVFDSPGRNSSASSVSIPFIEMAKGSPGYSSSSLNGRYTPHTASPRSSSDAPHHERYSTAQETITEEAEAWNKTRCAQRVSLVRLPSDLRIPMFLDQHQSPLKSS